jgi:hypothetical protein
VRVRFGDTVALPEAQAALAAVDGVSRIERQHGGLSLRVAGSMDPLVKALARFEVHSIGAGEPDLEDVFVAFYEDGPGTEVT